MGQSKDGGYIKKDVLSPEQTTLLQQLLSQASGNANQAAQGFSQFLPGGKGGQPIINQANQNFQQQTLPSILNAFGSGAKSSSALNQALAAGGANLNTDLASQLAQLQLGAAQGLGGLSQSQAGLGIQTPQFAFMQRQQPFWQSALLGALGIGGQAAGGFLGRPGSGPFGGM